MDTVNGVSTATAAPSLSMGSKSLASSYSSDYSLSRTLSLSLKRRSEFGGAASHGSIVTNTTNSPRGSGGDPSPKCLAIRVGAGSHKVSGLVTHKPPLANGQNRTHDAARGPSGADGPSVENTTVMMN
jgi:hypothetical protein